SQDHRRGTRRAAAQDGGEGRGRLEADAAAGAQNHQRPQGLCGADDERGAGRGAGREPARSLIGTTPEKTKKPALRRAFLCVNPAMRGGQEHKTTINTPYNPGESGGLGNERAMHSATGMAAARLPGARFSSLAALIAIGKKL